MNLSYIKRILAVGATVMAIGSTTFAATPATTGVGSGPTALSAKQQGPAITLGEHLALNRQNHTGVLHAPNGNPVAKLPANLIPSPSNNLVGDVDGYKIYMDIPAWVSSKHTKDETLKTSNDVTNMFYKTSIPGFGFQIVVSKNNYPTDMVKAAREAAIKNLPVVGTKLNDKETVTKELYDTAVSNTSRFYLATNFLKAYLTNNASAYVGGKIFDVNIDGKTYLMANLLANTSNSKMPYTNNLSFYDVENNNLVIVSYGYINPLTPKEQNDLVYSLMSLRIEAAK